MIVCVIAIISAIVGFMIGYCMVAEREDKELMNEDTYKEVNENG